MTHGAYPSNLARARARIQNKLNHAGITVTLNTSDETIAEMQRQADALLDDAAFAGNAAQSAEDERVQANLLSAKAKFLAIRATVLAGLHRILKDREAAGTDSDDPEAVEAKALEFLRHRGWRCERTDLIPVVIRALEGHPEAKEAVLGAIGGGKPVGGEGER